MKIDLTETSRVFNGKKMLIQPESLTPIRFKSFQVYSAESATNLDINNIYKGLIQIQNLLATGSDIIGNWRKAAQKAVNLTEGMKHFKMIGELVSDWSDEKAAKVLALDNAMKTCALFFNYEDEDLSRWDNALIEQKMIDFHNSQLPYSYFFFHAIKQTPILAKSLNATLESQTK